MGVTFLPKDAKRIANVVRKVERVPNKRTSVLGNISRDFRTVAVRNNSGITLPLGSPVWFADLILQVVDGDLIPYPGITSWGIMAGDCAPDAIGSAWMDGTAYVNVKPGLVLQSRDRLQLVAGKTYVERGHGQWGPLLFLEKDEVSGLAVVRIDRFYAQGM